MMSIKPNHHRLQHQHKIASPDATQKSFTFLPMLCSSTSTKQVKVSHRRCTSSSSTSSSTVTDDPSSPKVGCMGQVKRNNKVVNFPNIISFTSSATISNSSSCSTHHHVIKCHEPNNYTSNSIIKYHKFKRFFSTKSPTSVIAATRTTGSGSQKGKTGRKNVGNIVCRSKIDENINCHNKNEVDKGSLVNLVDMDPPLPVMKKTVQQEGNNKNGDNMSTLWKRRSGGAPLKSLQVQVIHQNLSLLSASTV